MKHASVDVAPGRSAKYQRAARRVVLELTNGTGELRWDSVDADVSVAEARARIDRLNRANR